MELYQTYRVILSSVSEEFHRNTFKRSTAFSQFKTFHVMGLPNCDFCSSYGAAISSSWLLQSISLLNDAPIAMDWTAKTQQTTYTVHTLGVGGRDTVCSTAAAAARSWRYIALRQTSAFIPHSTFKHLLKSTHNIVYICMCCSTIRQRQSKITVLTLSILRHGLLNRWMSHWAV